MPATRAILRHIPPASGALAALLAVLVCALGLLRVAPSAHHGLHGHDDAGQAATHDDAGCAVTLFAHGATPPPDLPRVTAPRPLVFAFLIAAPSRLLPAAARHLTPPGRGPPRSG
jgi:hypothetical protein